MNIIGYIKDLLYLHECVILPDFGGFVANYKHAEIKETQYAFLPPSKNIGFNKNLDTNDGLLINYVAYAEAISYIEAKRIVEKFIDEVNISLSKGNTVCFDDIGFFSYDKFHNLKFEPELTDNFLIDSFGLSSFQFPVLEPEQTVRRIEKKIKLKKVESERPGRVFLRRVAVFSVAGLFAITLISWPKMSSFRDDRRVGASFRPLISNHIVMNPESLLNNPESVNSAIDQLTDKRVALFYAEPERKLVENTIIESVDTTEIDNVILDTVQAVQTETTEEFVVNVEEKIKTSDSVIEKIKKTEDGPKFYLIAGSFKSKQQAKDWLPNLTNKGYETEILEKQDGQYRISIGVFSERNRADEELLKIKAKNVAVWILTKS